MTSRLDSSALNFAKGKCEGQLIYLRKQVQHAWVPNVANKCISSWKYYKLCEAFLEFILRHLLFTYASL